MNKIKLIEFTDKEDNYKLMYKWCSQKFIYEWFEQRKLSLDEIEYKYKTKLLNKEQKLFLINYNEKEIGFVQIYKYNENKIKLLNSYNNIFEYDIFIGESEYISKGIGTQIIKYINNYIYNNYLCNYIILRPFENNKRAIKCYEKCGFEKIYEYIGTDTLGNNKKIIVYILQLK